jgi:hypothetical protein
MNRWNNQIKAIDLALQMKQDSANSPFPMILPKFLRNSKEIKINFYIQTKAHELTAFVSLG